MTRFDVVNLSRCHNPVTPRPEMKKNVRHDYSITEEIESASYFYVLSRQTLMRIRDRDSRNDFRLYDAPFDKTATVN